MPLPEGVLPSEVSRNPQSTGLFIFGRLDPALAGPDVQAWLKEVSALLATLKEADDKGTVSFDAAFGFGSSFFTTGSAPRFGLAGTTPAGFLSAPALPAGFPFAPDFLIYAMSPQEEKLVQLLQWLVGRPPVVQVQVQRGFQRANRGELPFSRRPAQSGARRPHRRRDCGGGQCGGGARVG